MKKEQKVFIRGKKDRGEEVIKALQQDYACGLQDSYHSYLGSNWDG